MWPHIGHQSLPPTITFGSNSPRSAVFSIQLFFIGVTAVVHGWKLRVKGKTPDCIFEHFIVLSLDDTRRTPTLRSWNLAFYNTSESKDTFDLVYTSFQLIGTVLKRTVAVELDVLSMNTLHHV